MYLIETEKRKAMMQAEATVIAMASYLVTWSSTGCSQVYCTKSIAWSVSQAVFSASVL